MIRARYAVMLARTKLRSRRGALLATIAISSTLFAVLISGVIIFTAAEKSTVALVKAVNNNQYLVEVQPVIPGGAVAGYDPSHLTAENIKTAREYELNHYKTLKEKCTRLRLTCVEPDPNDSLLKPDVFADPNTPTDLRYQLNTSSSLLAEFEKSQLIKYSKTAKNSLGNLKEKASLYGGSGYYALGKYPLPSIPNQLLITNGKENFSDASLKSGDMSSYGYAINAVNNSMYEVRDLSLVNRYITYKDTSNLKGIPVIITTKEAATLFGKHKGIGDEPKHDQDRRVWLEKIRQELSGYTYQTCYRNQTEQTMLAKIQRDYADIKLHKDDKNYSKPSLIYEHPSTACGEITVKHDTRTQTEKDTENKKINTQKKLGEFKEPSHKVLTYQIVGFIDLRPYDEFHKSASSYLKNLLSYQTDLTSAIIPLQLFDKLPNELKPNIESPRSGNPEYLSALESLSPRVVAFSSVTKARDFMDNETCPSSETKCKKLYTAAPHGSNYLILDEVGKLFNKLMTYATPTVIAFSIFIIWLMISRLMSDSRKETAVYRAMGARRLDVAAIYLVYALIVGFIISIVSFIIAIFVSFTIDLSNKNHLTSIAHTSFGLGSSSDTLFTLFDLSSPLLGLIFITIPAVCILASIQPLLRNVLRPPIEDLRTE